MVFCPNLYKRENRGKNSYQPIEEKKHRRQPKRSPSTGNREAHKNLFGTLVQHCKINDSGKPGLCSNDEINPHAPLPTTLRPLPSQSTK
jgi:hypothetical protein